MFCVFEPTARPAPKRGRVVSASPSSALRIKTLPSSAFAGAISPSAAPVVTADAAPRCRHMLAKKSPVMARTNKCSARKNKFLDGGHPT
jgi:hypothetical protein